MTPKKNAALFRELKTSTERRVRLKWKAEVNKYPFGLLSNY